MIPQNNKALKGENNLERICNLQGHQLGIGTNYLNRYCLSRWDIGGMRYYMDELESFQELDSVP